MNMDSMMGTDQNMSNMDNANQTSSQMSHDMGSMSMSMMMMQMWFESSTVVTLWFKEWKTNSHGKYVGSIIGLFFLCIIQELVVRLRAYISRKAGHDGFQRIRVSENEASLMEVYPPPFSGRLGSPILIRLVLSALYLLNLFTSYLLMLAVMTYNVGYFIVILLGLTVGHFLFLPSTAQNDTQMITTEACCAQTMT